MTITVAPASACDAETVFALEKALVDRYEDVAHIDYDKVVAWIRENVKEDLPFTRRILADGEHVGFFKLKGRSFGSFFVKEAYRGRGIGSYVLDHFAAENGLPVTLYVFKKNTGALALYRRHGFAVKEEIRGTRYLLEKTK